MKKLTPEHRLQGISNQMSESAVLHRPLTCRHCCCAGLKYQHIPDLVFSSGRQQSLMQLSRILVVPLMDCWSLWCKESLTAAERALPLLLDASVHGSSERTTRRSPTPDHALVSLLSGFSFKSPVTEI